MTRRHLLTLAAGTPLVLAAPTRFSKPDPEGVFAEVKIYDGKGSPLREPRQDWEGARRRAASDAGWRAWLEERQAQLDEWMAKRAERAEWITGYWHDFVSPKDGSFLTFTPDPPGEELASPSDPKVKLTPKIMGGWVYVFRTRHAGKMVEAAHFYRLTGEERYAEWAAQQLDFYAANYENWPLRDRPGNRSRLMYQGLDEATMQVRFAQTALLLDGYPKASRRRAWYERLMLPIARGLGETMLRVHNIACWHRTAMGLTAIYGEDEALWREAIEGEWGIRRQLEDGVTGEYLWLEQSLGYNAYVVRALLPLFQAAWQRGRGGELRREMAVAENLMLAPLWMRFPNGQLPNPADNTGGSPRVEPLLDLLGETYRLFPTTVGAAAAAREKSWEALLDPVETPAGQASLPRVASWRMDSSRMAILVKDDWQVFFHIGQLDRSHAQAEALHYEAFLGEEAVVQDPGTVGYGSPLHRGFYTTAAAHNVPVINGEGQEGWHPGELLEFDAGAGVMRGAQPAYRAGVRVERELRIEQGALVDEVSVRVEGGNEDTRIGLSLPLQGRVELDGDFAPDAAFGASGQGPGFAYFAGARSKEAGKRVELAVQLGKRRLRLELKASAPMRLTHAMTPDVPPRQRETLHATVSGSQAVFRCVYRPAD